MNQPNHSADAHMEPMSGRPTRIPRTALMEYWRVERVAQYLDVSKKRVYQLVQERQLEAIRLGPRQMRVARASLDAYVSLLHDEAYDERDD